jgi:nucleoid-associated protein YgaU
MLAAAAFISGCGTSAKLAETPPYDVGEGDYLTQQEYEELSKDEALAYCQELEREIDIQNDNRTITQESLTQAESEIAALRTRVDDARRSLTTEVAASDATATRSDLPTSHTVVPGDWLSKIALKPEIYGNWREWPRIHRANADQIRDPDLIYPGQVLVIPRDGGGGSAGEDAGAGLGSADDVDPSGSADDQVAGRVHVVQEGETLRILAEREYGSREEWERIWEPNRDQIPDPNRLLAGASVIIP